MKKPVRPLRKETGNVCYFVFGMSPSIDKLQPQNVEKVCLPGTPMSMVVVVVVSLFRGGPIKKMAVSILNTCDLHTYTLWSPKPSKPLQSAHLNYYYLYILTKKEQKRRPDGDRPKPRYSFPRI